MEADINRCIVKYWKQWKPYPLILIYLRKEQGISRSKMEGTKGPSSSDVGAVNANLRAQPSESTDQDDRDLFQSRPANLECSSKECQKRKEELRANLEKSENDGRRKIATIQGLVNKKKESDRKIRNLEEDMIKQMELKEEKLNLAQGETDVVKAKCIELEKRNTKLEEDLDLSWLIIDGKDFADGEQQSVEANFAIAIGELDNDVPQQLKEGGRSQERTSDEEHECHLVLDQLKCPVNCVQAVFFNILEELGYKMCWNMFIKEMQRQLDAKRGEIILSACNFYHKELLELDLIVQVFFKSNIDSEVERKKALEKAVKEVEDKDARGLLLVCKKDDIGHCVQITPKRFQSASSGKTDFFDVQKKKSWPECAENFNSIHTLIVFKINEGILELFPCGRVNCLLAKHRALPAKQLTE